MARIWPDWRYSIWRYCCGPNVARLEVFNLEVFFGGPNLARLEVFFWPEFGPVGGIRCGGIFRWPEFGPVGGIFLARNWPGWRYLSVARIWPDWRYFSGPILARLEVFGPVLARTEVFFWRYFSRWPGSGPAVRTFRRYLGSRKRGNESRSAFVWQHKRDDVGSTGKGFKPRVKRVGGECPLEEWRKVDHRRQRATSRKPVNGTSFIMRVLGITGATRALL